MTRLNARTHLVGRLAAAAAGAAAIMLAGGCGAGQIAETAKITAAVAGGSGSVTIQGEPRAGTLWIKNVTYGYNDPSGYPAGSSAPISMRIINGSPWDVALTGVTASAYGQPGTGLGAVALGGSVASPTSTPSAAPSGTPSASPPVQAAELNIKIPANQLVELSTSGGQFLELTGLTQPLMPGTLTQLTFTFKDVSNPAVTIPSVTVTAQIGPPATPVSRVPADITQSAG